MPRGHDLTIGRTMGIAFDHGEDFLTGLTQFCAEHDIRQGYIPMFIAGLSQVDIVGTCDALDTPDAPVWTKVHVRREALIDRVGVRDLRRCPVAAGR